MRRYLPVCLLLAFICLESNVAQSQDEEIVDRFRKAKHLEEVFTRSENGDWFSITFQIASVSDTFGVRYNNTILDRRGENCSAPSLCNYQLYLPPEVCESTVSLTFFLNASVRFNYAGNEFCEDFGSHLQSSCDPCLSKLDPTSPGNNNCTCDLPWILFAVSLCGNIVVIAVIVLAIAAIYLFRMRTRTRNVNESPAATPQSSVSRTTGREDNSNTKKRGDESQPAASKTSPIQSSTRSIPEKPSSQTPSKPPVVPGQNKEISASEEPATAQVLPAEDLSQRKATAIVHFSAAPK